MHAITEYYFVLIQLKKNISTTKNFNSFNPHKIELMRQEI